MKIMSSYMDVRKRSSGDITHTIEIVPGSLLLDVDVEGRVLGVEKIGDEPIGLSDWYAIVRHATFGQALA